VGWTAKRRATCQSLDVLTVRGEHIAEVTAFRAPALFLRQSPA
jgi:hypothetical protein